MVPYSDIKTCDSFFPHTFFSSHCIFTLKILRVVDVKEPHVARVSRYVLPYGGSGVFKHSIYRDSCFSTPLADQYIEQVCYQGTTL